MSSHGSKRDGITTSSSNYRIKWIKSVLECVHLFNAIDLIVCTNKPSPLKGTAKERCETNAAGSSTREKKKG